jgi:hypothetical protein
MGHLLKLKCAHSPFNKCPFYTHDGASAKFSTNSYETDYSEAKETKKGDVVMCCDVVEIFYKKN